MYEFLTLDMELHRNDIIRLNEAHISWIFEQVASTFGIDVDSRIESVSKYVEETVEEYFQTSPSEGVSYLISIDDVIVGMGTLRILKRGLGEIKRMYVQPDFRGRGLGKALLNKLIDSAREFKLDKLYLETGPFMEAAQHIYKKAGFKEREEYSETEVPPGLRQLWLFMEKEL